eukprot:6187779-Pleurochrysis_carterae.AAC.1
MKRNPPGATLELRPGARVVHESLAGRGGHRLRHKAHARPSAAGSIRGRRLDQKATLAYLTRAGAAPMPGPTTKKATKLADVQEKSRHAEGKGLQRPDGARHRATPHSGGTQRSRLGGFFGAYSNAVGRPCNGQLNLDKDKLRAAVSCDRRVECQQAQQELRVSKLKIML